MSSRRIEWNLASPVSLRKIATHRSCLPEVAISTLNRGDVCIFSIGPYEKLYPGIMLSWGGRITAYYRSSVLVWRAQLHMRMSLTLALFIFFEDRFLQQYSLLMICFWCGKLIMGFYLKDLWLYYLYLNSWFRKSRESPGKIYHVHSGVSFSVFESWQIFR